MELVASVLLWLRSNELVSTSFVVVPPCFFVGTFKEKTSNILSNKLLGSHLLLVFLYSYK